MRTITDTAYSYNAETGTCTQTRIVPLFELFELSDDAKQRALSDYMDEHINDPYFATWFSDSVEDDIWYCVHDLENSIPWFNVKWSYNRYYSCDFDIEYKYNDMASPDELPLVKDNGYCYSMDMCDVWNAHILRLNAIVHHMEHVSDMMDKYPLWDMHYNDIEENTAFYGKLDDIYMELLDRWAMEFCAACEDVAKTVQGLLSLEWNYYTSEEYAQFEFEDEAVQGCSYYQRDNSGRVYYSDHRRWYTSDGKLYGVSQVCHECVSIIKA